MINNVIIRVLRLSDAESSYKLKNNAVLWRYMECDTLLPATIESERNGFETILNQPDCLPFAIICDDEYVGMVKIKRIDRGYGELSYYILKPELWGKGIAKAAITQALECAFDENAGLNLDVVSAFINPQNKRSYDMIRGLDFYRAGISIKDPKVERLDITKTRWQTRR